MKFKQGQIIYLKEEASVNLGENIQSLERPFVIISNDINNTYCPTLNIASITKQIHKSNYPMHVLISKRKYNLQEESMALLESVFTVNKGFVREIVATLDEEDIEKVKKAIIVQFTGKKRKENIRGNQNDNSKNIKPHRESRETNSSSCKAMLQSV